MIIKVGGGLEPLGPIGVYAYEVCVCSGVSVRHKSDKSKEMNKSGLFTDWELLSTYPYTT